MAKRLGSQQSMYAPTPRGEGDGTTPRSLLSSPRSAVVSPANRLSEKSKSFGEINPFDPKVNVIVLNGDIVPDTVTTKVPGLFPRRKIASVPGRIVTIPIPDHLEGDGLGPEEEEEEGDEEGGSDKGERASKGRISKFFKAPFTPRAVAVPIKDGSDSNSISDPDQSDGASPRAGSKPTTPRFWQRLRSPRAGEDKTAPSQQPHAEEKDVHGAAPAAAAADAKGRSRSPKKDLTITITDSNFGSYDDYNGSRPQLGTSLYSKIQERREEGESKAGAAAEEEPPEPVLTPLQKLVQEQLEKLEKASGAMFQLYAWVNLSDKERKTTRSLPKTSYEETVQSLRVLHEWTDIGSKRKFQALSPEEKREVQPVYMKILSLLMAHGAIATGCDMAEVMQWHGNHLGYKIGKHVWNMVELQYCVDSAL